MTFFQKLFAGFKAAAAEGLRPFFGAGSWWSRQGASHPKLMEQGTNWVFDCITRISRTLISQPLRLWKKTGDGPDDWEEITDHPLLELLHKPNPIMPGSDLLEVWSQHEDLVGNAYWLLLGVSDEKSLPTGIIPLNPAYMKVEPSVDKQTLTYRYTVPGAGTAKTYYPFEILHFRMANPNSMILGLGPAEGSLDAIDTDNWMREWNRRFFQNGAIGSAVLETEETSAESIRLLRESFEDRHAGVSKAHKTMVLPRGIKLADKGFGQKDLDFVESRKQMRDEILAAFGVPGIVLGLGLGETINRSSAETQEYVFSKYTIRPKLRHLETYLNEFLVTRYGDDLVLEFDDPVTENFEQKIAFYGAALAGAAFLSINEVRSREGLPPITGGDSVMGSLMDVPVGKPTDVASSGKASTRRLPASSMKALKGRKLKEEFAEKVAKAVLTGLQVAQKTEVAGLATEDWEERWKAFVARTEPEEKRMKEAMAGYAKEMTERAIEALRKKVKRAVKAKRIPELLDRDLEIAAVIDVMSPIYKDLLKKEGIAAAELVGAAFDEAEERMNKALDKSIELMASSYTDETLGTLRDRLKDGLEAGESLQELTDSVTEIGEWSATSRAQRVARTEAYRTANFATKEAWKQSGVVKTIKWYTGPNPCEDCKALDGKVVGIEENFLDKGDETATGREITYADIEAGALHPNCFCYTRPETIEI
jgi:HK97 family phage portal protein